MKNHSMLWQLTKEKKLSLVHCNLQSSFSKFGVLKANLSNIKHNFSMIAISETGVGKCGILANLFSDYLNTKNQSTIVKGDMLVPGAI